MHSWGVFSLFRYIEAIGLIDQVDLSSSFSSYPVKPITFFAFEFWEGILPVRLFYVSHDHQTLEWLLNI